MKKYILILLILILTGLIFYIYKLTTYTYINAKFGELRPIHNSMNVYYKGIIIGRAKEKKHTKSFQHTLIKIVLYPKNLLLPDNTTVLLKKEKRNNKEKDFLELIYPKEPSKNMITNGATLEGKSTVDIDTYMANRDVDELDQIKENLIQSTQNLNYALEALTNLFNIASDTIKQNQDNLYQTTANFKKTSSKINNSIGERKLNNTLSSIESTSENINNLVQNLNNQTPSTLDDIQGITSNINSITCGIRKTLRKKCGTLRLFFGQVIDECEN